MTDRDDLEVEALVTDRYLESLLASRDRRAAPDPSDPNVDPAVRTSARALEAQLARVHPSFRFEERLAGDLESAAARQRRGGRVGRLGAIRRLEPRQPAAARALQPATQAAAQAGTHARTQVSRPLLIGGALTSAAISIAGAYVAWRRGRPPVDPMVRAIRAAHRTGLARRLPARGPRLALPRGARSR